MCMCVYAYGIFTEHSRVVVRLSGLCFDVYVWPTQCLLYPYFETTFSASTWVSFFSWNFYIITYFVFHDILPCVYIFFSLLPTQTVDAHIRVYRPQNWFDAHAHYIQKCCCCCCYYFVRRFVELCGSLCISSCHKAINLCLLLLVFSLLSIRWQ